MVTKYSCSFCSWVTVVYEQQVFILATVLLGYPFFCSREAMHTSPSNNVLILSFAWQKCHRLKHFFLSLSLSLSLLCLVQPCWIEFLGNLLGNKMTSGSLGAAFIVIVDVLRPLVSLILSCFIKTCIKESTVHDRLARYHHGEFCQNWNAL